jgi:hypothetical protein
LNLWDKIKSGEVKGFSIEGVFKYNEPIETEMGKIDINTISLDQWVEELVSD